VRAADAAARESAHLLAARLAGGDNPTDATLVVMRELYLRGVSEGRASLRQAAATHALGLPLAITEVLGLSDPTAEQIAALVALIRGDRLRVIEECAKTVERSGQLSGMQQRGRIAENAAESVRHMKRTA
jgi:hypothetical protein